MNRRHIDTLEAVPNGQLTAQILIDWYQRFQPIGSGPLATQRYLCALIEHIAMEKGWQLPKAQGLQKKREKVKQQPKLPSLANRVREHVIDQVNIIIHPKDDGMDFTDMEMDSLDLVSIHFRIEDEFDINISDEEAISLTNITKIAEFLKGKGIK